MRRDTRILVIIAAVLGTLAINGVAYFAFVRKDMPIPSSTEAPVAVQNPPSSAAPAGDRRSMSAEIKESETSGLARAHRAAGLAALEQGRPGPALTEFQEARKLAPDAPGDLPELLRIASEMADHESGARTKEPQQPVEPERSKAPRERPRPRQIAREPEVSSKRTDRTVIAKAQTQPPTGIGADAPEVRPTGLLLVTSVPSGLVVSVDGHASDITPSRIPVEPGRHTVEFLRGERRLLSRTLSVAAGEVASVDGDTLAGANSAPEREPAAETPAEPVATPRPAATAAVKTDNPAASSATPPFQSPPSTGRGEVYVNSPDVYGEVWVNGRAYGYPPVIVRDLPAGTASVQIRSNGKVRRTESVRVDPSHRTSLVIH